MTKDEVVAQLDELLKESVPDDNVRYTLIERVYRDVVKKCEDDARDLVERLLFAKSE